MSKLLKHLKYMFFLPYDPEHWAHWGNVVIRHHLYAADICKCGLKVYWKID